MSAIVGLLLHVVPLVVLIRRGRARRAWLWWAATTAIALAGVVTPWVFGASVLLLVALPIDAIRVARRARREPGNADVPHAQVVPLRRSMPASVHVVAILAASLATGVAIRTLVAEAVTISSASSEPTLSIGDQVLVEKVRVRLRGARRGEVVAVTNVCDPRTKFVKRVVAAGGDRVEVRCGTLHVNGAAVPTEAVAAPCTYHDREDHSRWRAQPCQRRRERIGDRAYDVLGAVEPPRHGPHPHDFPDAAGATSAFYCPARDARSADHRARAAGRFESSPAAGDACAPQRAFVVPAGHLFVLGDNRDNSGDSRTWGPVPDDAVIGIVRSIWWSRGPDGLRWDRIGLIE